MREREAGWEKRDQGRCISYLDNWLDKEWWKWLKIEFGELPVRLFYLWAHPQSGRWSRLTGFAVFQGHLIESMGRSVATSVWATDPCTSPMRTCTLTS